MKLLLTAILISFVTIAWGQIDTTVVATRAGVGIIVIHPEDSLQAERFFLDSLGGQYMVEYRYEEAYLDSEVVKNSKSNLTLPYKMLHGGSNGHEHYIATCKIISYKGNKQHIVADNIKAIYSPTECSSDNSKLWLKRLYEYQNKKR